MNQNRPVVSYALPLLLAALLLGGCATPVSGLRHDPSFDWPALARGGIAVVGITSLLSPLAEGEESLYRDTLSRALRDHAPELRVVQPAAAGERLDEATRARLLDAFRRHADLERGQIATLADSLATTARYAVLARLESDSVHQQRSDSEQELTAPIAGDDKRHRPTGEVEVVLELYARRSGSVALQVYDLERRQSVWSGAISQNVTRRNEYRRRYLRHRPHLRLFADLLMEEIVAERADAAYPTPPDTLALINALFSGFTDNLPAPPR